MTDRNGSAPVEAGEAIRQKPLIERSTRAGELGYTWDALAKEGHCFPQRCPDWSGAGTIDLRANLMTAQTVPTTIVVCSCGVMKPVPMTKLAGRG